MYRVVLVDDEHMIVTGLERAVPWSKFDCQVVGTAYDGLQGLQVIRDQKPDMVVTDIRMPNCDGLSMVAALKSEFPRLQIAVLTAFRDFDYAQQAIRLGVCRYLLKPSRMDEIEEAIGCMTGNLKNLPEELPETPEEASSGGFVVNTALQYIAANYAQHISLLDVADHVFVSQWHLSKLLNRHTGKSFLDIVNEQRVKQAKELLKNPALKVRDVAEQVGFADVAHFSKIFKKYTGVSPVAFRDGME